MINLVIKFISLITFFAVCRHVCLSLFIVFAP